MQSWKRAILPLVAVAALLFLVASHVYLKALAAGPGRAAAPTLGREEDPVVLSTAALPQLAGIPISDLKLYTFDGVGWNPIPFQIDERDADGKYVVEDGLVDDNDELVFMAGDVGHEAPITAWPADSEAQANPRFQLTATDPLTPTHMGWVYLFQSTTLPLSPESYVSWDYDTQTAIGQVYTATLGGVDDPAFIGLSDLRINGAAADILDRQKIRAQAGFLFITEQTLVSLGIVSPLINIPVVGAVRGIGGDGLISFGLYRSRLDFGAALDTGIIGDLNFIRTSIDFNPPADSAIDTLCLSNGMTVPIDGVPDGVPAEPAMDWFQASGAPGSLVMTVPVLEVGDGLVTTYHKDDDTSDPLDTGDNLSYGDTGVRIDNPATIINFLLSAYILPADVSPCSGGDYLARVQHPIETTVAEQNVGDTPTPTVTPTVPPTATPTPTPEPEAPAVYLPLLRRDE